MFTIQSNESPKLNQRSPFYIEQDLQKVESEIRKIPELTAFQLYPSEEELKNLAGDGPLVTLNVNKERSDALIITETGVKYLALKKLLFSEAECKISSINRISNRHPKTLDENNMEMKDLLKWLWLTAVKPVLEELGFINAVNTSVLPRIWWITNGIMGFAPLHAAGIYDDVYGENAMDFVVSSYIHTAKSLKFARETLKNNGLSRRGELCCFDEEVQAIKEDIQKYYKPVLLKDGSREEALQQLGSSSIVHFACHGVSIGFKPSSNPPKSPSDSYLCLRDSEDGTSDFEKITVEDLVKVRHPNAQLAYLSACSTAEISAKQLGDEMIHIANAFQLAGFPHVIGTLWEADGESAMMVSRAFYENLFRNPLAGPWQNNIANALHQAVRILMRDPWFKSDFLAWVLFIHIGA
ncbi:hypothetical protein ABW20_dc0109837 [Dactylellina cionopaga]|nr:hypothetical protein ABW20_dc0109837 [Dactylellina cionopaga]